ncbi:MAG TPA: DUF1207 domain-containing protein [Gemmatimonadales bacterium]|nr:DUF1207 domain-containing protein [Gemmatimonadales bacterium]
MRTHHPLSRALPRLLAALAILVPGPLAAQSRIFPAAPRFELPWASPRTWAFAGRYIRVNTADDKFGPGTEAEVVEGENFPVYAFRRGPLPITLGFGAAVVAHYRMDDPKSSQISDDWLVGINGQFALTPKWTVVGEVLHESSHLGDEYAQVFAADSALAKRIDWTRMTLNGWGFYTTGPWRLAAGVHYAYTDELHLPKGGLSAGVDYKGPSFRFLGQRTQVVGGVFLDGAAETDWRAGKSVRVGVSFPDGEQGWRRLSLSVIGYDGPSTQRQFYTQQTSYIGMELRFDL